MIHRHQDRQLICEEDVNRGWELAAPDPVAGDQT